jgi:phosphoribosylformimino-5-aminoimidazole carboxamide ribotide isomerase
MDILPAVDIRGGKCVQLVQGDYERETVFGVDPVAMAMHWAGLGASRLHVVDLDGAKEGRPVNDAVIRRIVRESGLRVQVAGGVREHADIHRWAEAGADRVVIGTLAVERPDLIEHAMEKHQDKVSIAVDAREGKVAVKGWLETATLTVDDFVMDMASRGVQHFIYTDISRDGMLGHPDFGGVGPIVELARRAVPSAAGEAAHLIYSGGVTSVDDVQALVRQNIEGVIIGTALYNGSIDLGAALAVVGT